MLTVENGETVYIKNVLLQFFLTKRELLFFGNIRLEFVLGTRHFWRPRDSVYIQKNMDILQNILIVRFLKQVVRIFLNKLFVVFLNKLFVFFKQVVRSCFKQVVRIF